MLKGIFLGGSNVVPGISAGTTAILLGIYKTLVDSINDLFSSKRKGFKSLKILLPTGFGIGIGIFLFAHIFTWLFKIPVYESLTYSFIMGLIVGSIPLVIKLNPNMKPSISRILSLLTGLFIFVLITTLNPKNSIEVFTPEVHYVLFSTFQITSIKLLESFRLLFLGFLTSATMILPGISGSALLVALGQYETILNLVAQRLLIQGLFFASGIALGSILCAKIISSLLNKYPGGTYYFIIGLLLSSVFQVFLYSNITHHLSLSFTGVAVLLFLIGFFISYSFSKLKQSVE
jgi:putative membrane protein